MLKLASRPSEASKKLYERSEFRVAFALAFAFSQIHEGINRKIAPWIERKRDSIEFERSENHGQFFQTSFLIIFISFKSFLWAVSLMEQAFQSLTMTDWLLTMTDWLLNYDGLTTNYDKYIVVIYKRKSMVLFWIRIKLLNQIKL